MYGQASFHRPCGERAPPTEPARAQSASMFSPEIALFSPELAPAPSIWAIVAPYLESPITSLPRQRTRAVRPSEMPAGMTQRSVELSVQKHSQSGGRTLTAGLSLRC